MKAPEDTQLQASFIILIQRVRHLGKETGRYVTVLRLNDSDLERVHSLWFKISLFAIHFPKLDVNPDGKYGIWTIVRGEITEYDSNQMSDLLLPYIKILIGR